MRFVKYIFFLIDIFILIGILTFIYSWRIEPRWVKWEYVNMPIKNLPDSLENKVLIQISDIHLGDKVDEEFIITVFNKINILQPDFVVYTGDFISLPEDTKPPYQKLINTLQHKAEGKLGTLAIFGNHDYGILSRNPIIADSLEKILVQNNIEVLRNQSTNKSGLHFIGIEEYWSKNFNLSKAMKSYNPTLATIVLCHNPDVVDLIKYWNNYEGWILSGHTHGGQVRIPFNKPIWTPVENKNYDEGLKKLSHNRTLYINRGLGHSIRIRFNVRPEVTVFKLSKDQS